MRGRIHDDGFTLLEMLVVLAILAVATLLTLPMVRSSTSASPLDASAQSVLQIFSDARAAALRTGSDVSIVFDAHTRQFTSPALKAGYQVPRGIDVIAIARKTAGNVNQVRFTFFGESAASGGSVQLQQGAEIRTLKISWLTGQIALGTQ